MKVTVRLYRQYDIDLIYLAHYEDFSLIRTARECLNAYATGTAYRITMPNGKFTAGAEDKTSYEYDFSLDDEKDQDAIRLLRAVRNHHRNAFIKNLLRGYMIAPCTEAYLNSSDLIESGTGSFERIIRTSDTRAPKAKVKPSKYGNLPSQAEAGERRTEDKAKTKRAKQPQTVKDSKKKKNAIEALGNIVLKPRETDNFIAPAEPRTSALPPKLSRQSVMFPDNPSVSEPVPAATPVHAPIKENDESFDVFDTISNMVNNY